MVVICRNALVTTLLVVVFRLVDALKGVDDSVLFRIDWKLKTDIPAGLLAVAEQQQQQGRNPPDSNVISITSGSDEKYLCTIPDVTETSRKRIERYAGPTPNELLIPIYGERICSYRLEPFWAYELCHGRYILQYHQEKEGKGPRTEYYLGQYRSELTKQEDKAFDQLNPPMRKIDDQMLPYYTVSYTQGTVCDISGKPRMTNVVYVCMQDSRNQIYSLSELSSCTYEVVVLTPRLCSHPSFQPNTPKEHEIVCYSRQTDAQSKPSALLDFESDQYESKVTEKEFARRRPYNQDPDEDDGIVEIEPKRSAEATSRTAEEPAEQQLALDEQLARGFLLGEQCMYGGAGWWRYQYCHGIQVMQFHEPRDGSDRIEIILGTWDRDTHLHWISMFKKKRPVQENGQTVQISHFYSGGDVCAETGKHRNVEVQLRCRQPEASANTVTLFLLEPKTCEYVLGVESPLFCSLLQYADENGLLPTLETGHETD